MIIGISREMAAGENRVSITPTGVHYLRQGRHQVLVEHGAGTGSDFTDYDYLQAGGMLVDRRTLFGESELLVKVQGPLPEETSLLRNGQTIFSFLNLAANRQLTDCLLEKKITAFAFETLEIGGIKPLLTPMSRIAGQMAPLIGNCYFMRGQKSSHGTVQIKPESAPVRVVIIGAGIAGQAAARTAAGIGMEAVVLNRGGSRLREIKRELGSAVKTGQLNDNNLREELAAADIVIGAICSAGSRSPVVIREDMLAGMKPGAVIVDLAIDQGGIASTSRPTTKDDPVFSVGGILHYCVPNIPGSYPRTSTRALAEATLPYIRILAYHGADEALVKYRDMISALNLKGGEIVHKGLAAFRKAEYSSANSVFMASCQKEAAARDEEEGFYSLCGSPGEICFDWKRECQARQG
jgi:alanine dehydrogenase